MTATDTTPITDEEIWAALGPWHESWGGLWISSHNSRQRYVVDNALARAPWVVKLREGEITVDEYWAAIADMQRLAMLFELPVCYPGIDSDVPSAERFEPRSRYLF